MPPTRQRARPRRHGHAPARRGHAEPDLAADRGGKRSGSAPISASAMLADRTYVMLRRCRPTSRRRWRCWPTSSATRRSARRSGARPRPDADRIAQLQKDPTRVARRAASGGALRRHPSLWRDRAGGDRRRSRSSAATTSSRSSSAGCGRTRLEISSFRPAAGRSPAAARSASSATGARRPSRRA